MDINQIIHENYDKVLKLAKQLQREYHLSFDAYEDLQKVGYIAMIEQLPSYDEDSGVSYWSYAYKGVRQKMLHEVRFLLHTVTIPEHLNRQFAKISKIRAEYPELSGDALLAMIREKMKISAEKAEELLILSAREKIALDDDELSEELADVILADPSPAPDEILLGIHDAEMVEQIIHLIDTRLPHRQAEYLRLYFGIDEEPHTLEEIAEEFCVTVSTVEKGVRKGIDALRGMVK